MFDPDAPDPLDRPGPRPWSARTRQERVGFVLGFAAVAGSIALIVVADTPAFRFGLAIIAAVAAGWFALRAWIAGTAAAHRLHERRPVAAVVSALFAAIDIGLGGAVLWYSAPIVFA